MADELEGFRQQINDIDHQLLQLLQQRASCAQQIGKIKSGNLYRPEREAQVLRRLGDLAKQPLGKVATQAIFRQIMSYCLALEQSVKVAFLGPNGTFSEMAAQKHFGSAPEFLAQDSIEQVFKIVESGTADYGVVPVENSSEGSVGLTLDLLLANPLQVCGQVNLRIHHQLMAQHETLNNISKVYSHAQSLAQCQRWLMANYPKLQRIPVSSNAEAAKLASEQADSCAIAAYNAAYRYQLNVLASNIEDDNNNTTQFFILGKHDAEISGDDRTSIVCSSPNQSGAIHVLLEPFALNGVSLCKLQSRPAHSGLWEYVFYIDIEGHRHQSAVEKALAQLRSRAAFVKILGSYPVSVF